MLLKKHTASLYTLIAILFLFFGSSCTAAPVVKESLERHQLFHISLQYSQDLNEIEYEEEVCLETFSSYQDSHGVKYHNRHFKRNANNDEFEYNVTRQPKSFSASFVFIPRPAYYVLLFRHNLF